MANKNWRMALHSPNSPIFSPSNIFPCTVVYINNDLYNINNYDVHMQETQQKISELLKKAEEEQASSDEQADTQQGN